MVGDLLVRFTDGVEEATSDRRFAKFIERKGGRA
jgi:hypothetical protein